MSEQLDKLASCEQVTEWVTPADERFVNTFGQVPYTNWKLLRQHWQLDWRPLFTNRHEFEDTYRGWTSSIKRLLVPAALHETVQVWLSPHGSDEAFMGLDFDKPEDWQQCMPSSETTRVPNEDSRFNMAVALCGKVAGLTIISREYPNGEDDLASQFDVHPLHDDVLAKLLTD